MALTLIATILLLLAPLIAIVYVTRDFQNVYKYLALAVIFGIVFNLIPTDLGAVSSVLLLLVGLVHFATVFRVIFKDNLVLFGQYVLTLIGIVLFLSFFFEIRFQEATAVSLTGNGIMG